MPFKFKVDSWCLTLKQKTGCRIWAKRGKYVNVASQGLVWMFLWTKFLKAVKFEGLGLTNRWMDKWIDISFFSFCSLTLLWLDTFCCYNAKIYWIYALNVCSLIQNLMVSFKPRITNIYLINCMMVNIFIFCKEAHKDSWRTNSVCICLDGSCDNYIMLLRMW